MRRSLLLFSLCLPALALFCVLFAVPVGRLLGLSVEGGSLAAYHRALTAPAYMDVFVLTFWIALAVTGLTLLLGYPVAYLMATTTRTWRAVGFMLVLLPLWTSVLVRTYAWMVLLGRNGVVNKALIGLGLIERPMGFLYTTNGVLIGMVHVLLPYMVLPLYASLRRLDPSLLQAAEGLGAPGWRVLARIVLPLTAGGIAAGCVLVFVLSLGFFITPALLGGGRVVMIGVMIQQQVSELLDWNFAAALSALLLAISIAIYALVQSLARRLERHYA
jgi:ABC-type spermidine/putrescine transport system permease subunit I